jgi:hypothetical protein
MLARVTHFLGLTNVRRTRRLPLNGRVLVTPGQRVHAADPLAETTTATRHVLLDVRHSLGYARTDEAQQAIKRQEGEKVEKGDIIAETGGMFSRILRAPSAGQIVTISGGRVLLEVESQPLQVLAGIPGVVSELIPERGAVVENNGALIQGAWGNGSYVGEGLMVNLLKEPDDLLERSMLEINLRGAIVAAGHCQDADTLHAAAQLPLRGLVIASMPSELIPVARGMELPIVVLEGFGRAPMNATAFRLLTTNDKRDVSINSAYNPVAGDRPELFIPLPANAAPPPEMAYFAPNQVVRIQGDPYRGQTGTILRIRPGLTILPSGIRAPAADIRLEQDTQVVIPLANLDVIE